MSNVSKKLARTAVVGLWTIASMALAGQSKTSPAGCYEGGVQGKPVPTAKTQDECQKMGEKFSWVEGHEHGKGHEKAQAAQAKPKVKTKPMKAESKAVETQAADSTTTSVPQPASQSTPATETAK